MAILSIEICNDLGLWPAGTHAERVVELEAEVSTLRESLAELNRLLSLHIAEVTRLQSWQESVLAEVGLDNEDMYADGSYKDPQHAAEYYSSRSEHLAAKLVEARNALQLAFNHLDMHSLQISHCKDHAAIVSALAQSQPQPLSGEPHA